MAKTIREIIKEKSEALRFVDQLGPLKASEELVALSSLLSSLNAHVIEKQFLYNQCREVLRTEKTSASDAKISAEATLEWKEWQEAKQQGKALEELIRSVKYYLRASGEEQKISQY
jgi:predicted transcriptional regulator